MPPERPCESNVPQPVEPCMQQHGYYGVYPTWAREEADLQVVLESHCQEQR
jgi:hypothetical protein